MMKPTHLSSRRSFLRLVAVGLAGATLEACGVGNRISAATALPVVEDAAVTNGDEALARLVAGNSRYISFQSIHPHQTTARRSETAQGQHPFAIVLGCADSRVSPELLFDQGVGDLFVVRVAGNILDNTTIGSIEFAVKEFGAPLLMVLGHERCGAVKATLDAIDKGGEAAGEIGSIVTAIRPAVEKIPAQAANRLDDAVKANVAAVVSQLKATGPILTAAISANTLKIVGAHYDLDQGAVTLVAS